MAFQNSPGVNSSEIDQTTVVPSVSTTAGAFAGYFNWGPVNKIIQLTSEVQLVQRFGKPDNNSAQSFFSAANFLAYGDNLNVVRAVGSTAKNGTGGTTLLVQNSDVFQASYLNQNNGGSFGAFMARYPGAIGNSLSVSVCDTAGQFSSWAYKSLFAAAPGTSEQAAAVGGSADELHIVVIDAQGLFTGQAGTVLETYAFVSKAFNASINGVSNYYKQVVFNQSKYVYAIDPPDYSNQSATWGGPLTTAFNSMSASQTIVIAGGVDSVAVDGDLETAYDLFSNKEVVNIALVITGDASANVQNHVITSIAATRGDCVAFISPPQSAVVNQAGSEVSNIATWLTALGTSSTFAFADSGYKYQYDKYNNTYRWIALNADIAGLCVFTDTVRDPWFSPAGYTRGQIKNAVKLAWNPSKPQRDVLYNSGVNSVVSFPGQGIVLFGDKTLTTKPSAFDRINVRRLFIVLEKSISTAAKFSLFEQNDEVTRAQFVSTITPFLRDVMGRRGITDFKVVCDTTNNTSGVIDSNQFVGDIYIKPSRSINYIQLNFVAVGTGVDFTTIVGAA
jgi:Phage tail sheath protein subtilisin-like domain/Phage tail sheath C-terminal domain